MADAKPGPRVLPAWWAGVVGGAVSTTLAMLLLCPIASLIPRTRPSGVPYFAGEWIEVLLIASIVGGLVIGAPMGLIGGLMGGFWRRYDLAMAVGGLSGVFIGFSVFAEVSDRLDPVASSTMGATGAFVGWLGGCVGAWRGVGRARRGSVPSRVRFTSLQVMEYVAILAVHLAAYLAQDRSLRQVEWVSPSTPRPPAGGTPMIRVDGPRIAR